SVFVVTALVTLINRWLILPRFAGGSGSGSGGEATDRPASGATTSTDDSDRLHPRAGLAVLAWTVLVTGFVLAALLPADGFLRGDDGSVAKS
ncbi:hypothetical protein ABTC96_19950, partial [Acinetobacter baumannii]